MKKELEKNYNPMASEDRIYKNWLDKGYFHTNIDKSKKPYTIVIPPPNITGQLHMGHALDNTLQDILIRFKRMQGYNAVWIPGTDHASISTEVRIVNKMRNEGLTKADVGREGFLEQAWEWKKQYGGKIIEQLKKLGSSCDWYRERFTMDEGLSNAVLEVFVRLYGKGLIYRGEKLINWCPKCRTTISDAEVEHTDHDGFLWHLKYPINPTTKDISNDLGRPDVTDEFLQFATTRPETMLGDTAIAVNPADDRYKHLVGRTVTVPIVNREIPIIADDYVEMDFGSGVVKITPGHDPNDFEVGERHNLKRINIMNDDGTLNENAGSYSGLDHLAAREKIVEEFKQLGLFVKVENYSNAVGTHERCHTVIEPLLKTQWFVKMDDLAKPAIEAYKSGELRFIPERFGKIYLHWLENIRDWCISRQLWWGHRIPAYYCQGCGHIAVSKQKVSVCPECGGGNVVQDEDTLDTWFSSALWPFSTLGWPEDTEDFKHFYPTSVLVTAYDIIFFWVVRMVFSGLEHTGKLPFRDVLIHGLIRDSKGQKFSKSLGNGIDPLEIIDVYGADALRLMLVTGNTPGADMRYRPEKLEATRNFLNKLWNASRFILMNLSDDMDSLPQDSLTSADKWILSRINSVIKEVTENIDNYELAMAVQRIHDFVWDEFCDWYIEMVKPRLYNVGDPSKPAALWTLKTVIIDALKLMHPFIPFITEEIFSNMQSEEETIMLSKWPVYNSSLIFPREEREIETIKEAVKGIRNIRSEMNVPPSRKSSAYIVSESEEVRNIFNNGRSFVMTLGWINDLLIQTDKTNIKNDAVSVVINNAVIYIPFAELVDIKKELERLNKERDRLAKEVKRVSGMLSNVGFMSKAPQHLIDEEREKSEKYVQMLNQIEKQISDMTEKIQNI